VSLYNVRPKKGMNVKEKEMNLRRKVERIGGEHISYDAFMGVWKFKV